MTQSETPQLIYSLLLILLIGSSLLVRYRGNKSLFFKHGLIWTILIVSIALLYQLRFSLEDAKNTFIHTFSPSTPLDKTTHSTIIERSSDGHFYVNAIVNGTPIHFVIDTGATNTVLSLADAKRLGLDINTLEFNRPYQTANGTIFGANITLDSITIGSITLKDVSASVNQAPLDNSLLGMSFLNRLDGYTVARDNLTFIKH